MSALLIMALLQLFGGGVLLLQQMRALLKENNPIPQFESHSVVSDLSAWEADALTSIAGAKSANKLSEAEELSPFEQDLEADDSGKPA